MWLVAPGSEAMAPDKRGGSGAARKRPHRRRSCQRGERDPPAALFTAARSSEGLGAGGARPWSCTAEDAEGGTGTASPRQDGQTPGMFAFAEIKLLFSRLHLQTTINNGAEQQNKHSLFVFSCRFQ